MGKPHVSPLGGNEVSNERMQGEFPDVPPLRNESGNYDARKIAKLLGLDMARVARVLAVDEDVLRRDPATPEIQERAMLLEKVFCTLEELYGTDHAVAWLKTPSPLWNTGGNLSALDIVGLEPWGLDLVAETVEAMRRGDPIT